ncbi:nuclear transport factor 2 family protein [Helicobacter sp. MIT 05-5294]|uniref:nuclear transport factor 2 family protein n=1 Tax=Helicobacter sp. MIT 05-5294 TaxID=1548150 RepID=UPI00051FB85F|nr:nuclear transport factor 2 family protein [Helicobacter sp. MIT 05-5294]TLD85607.1 nuclear transport factor 2 family protein [Helicobacter sp. MIT 05-5294]
MTKLSDYEAVINTINFYTTGAIKGKREIAEKAFTKDATMYGANKDGSTASGSIKNLYKGLETSGEAKECESHIDVLYINKNIASVRVVMEDWHGLNFTDLHQLFKINGEWKIVSKTYQAY